MGKGNKGKSGRSGRRPPQDILRGTLRQARPHIANNLRLGFQYTGQNSPSSITFNSLANSIIIATSATAGVCLYDAVRIKSVEITATPAQGTYGTVRVSWPGVTVGTTGSTNYRSSTSDGILPAYVKMSPPRGSQAGQWQPAASGAVAFTLSSLLQGTTALICTVYVDVEFAMNEDVGSLAAGNALLAATAGQVYYRGLDGLAIATTQFYPLGVIYVI